MTSYQPQSGKSEDSLYRGRRMSVAGELVPLLAAITVSCICYGLVSNRGLGLPILGYNISPAERVMHGEVPYRDFIYNYTPGVLWFNAWLMSLFGATVSAVNAGLFAFKIVTVAALYFAARRLTTSYVALIPIALTVLWIGYKVVFRAYPTQYSMLFVLMAMTALLMYGRSARARWLVLSGIASGVVFIFKQNVGAYVILAGSSAVLIEALITSSPKDGILSGLKRAAVLWIAFAAVVALVLCYLAYQGALGPMLSHFASLAGQYGERRAIIFTDRRAFGIVLLAATAIVLSAWILIRKAPALLEPFALSLITGGLLLILIPGRAVAVKSTSTSAMFYFAPSLFVLTLAVLGGTLSIERRRGEPVEKWWEANRSTVIVALFSLAAYLEVYPRADYAHLVRVLPPVFLLATILTVRGGAALKALLNGRVSSPRRTAMLCASVPILLLGAVGLKDTWQPRFAGGLRFSEQTPLKVERAQGILVSRKQAAFVDDLDAVIRANSTNDDPIFAFAPRATAFYFLSNRRNPTRFTWWRSVGIRGRDRDELRDALNNGTPKLVLITDAFHNARVLEALGGHYHQVGEAGDVKVFDRN